jgi:thioredoxin reductase (NADPH)
LREWIVYSRNFNKLLYSQPSMENVIILGTGISGATAAIYTARANLKPLLISGPEDGGQLTLTTEVENFPGFPDGVQGPELVDMAKKQAEKFGARFEIDIANEFTQIKDGFELTLESGKKVQTKTLIISTGASARWLGIPSEEKFKGKGVSTCATCDGFFYKDKEVIVIGGGDSAMEESLFLTKFCRKVTVVHRRDELRASKIMQDKAKKNEKIDFIWNTAIEEIVGDKFVSGAKLKNLKTNEITALKCDGVFLAIGHVPNTKLFKGKLNMNEQGYLTTDRFMNTNIKGVFGAGDVQDTRYRQAITAAGSGCQAAMEVEKYLAGKE